MADTMTLEELRESLDVGCLPNTDRPRWFAAIDAAIKQREQDRRDAARYRWLREGDNDDRVFQRSGDDWDDVFLPRKERLDAAIDAAMNGGDDA